MATESENDQMRTKLAEWNLANVAEMWYLWDWRNELFYRLKNPIKI